jgi:hypothetical protein
MSRGRWYFLNSEIHMRWMSTNYIVSSMHGLLGSSNSDEPRSVFRIEDIRKAMLDSLGDQGCASFSNLERRVLFAADLQGLWYLRSDIMAAISSTQGESVASQKLRQITCMFEGLLPKGMFPKPRSVGN